MLCCFSLERYISALPVVGYKALPSPQQSLLARRPTFECEVCACVCAGGHTFHQYQSKAIEFYFY